MPVTTITFVSPILYYARPDDRLSFLISRDSFGFNYTSVNEIDFVIPLFVTDLTVDILSGGGGGGGVVRPEGPNISFDAGGGGGGGGSLVRNRITTTEYPFLTSSVSQFQYLNCTIGSGGAGGLAGLQGTQGGTSTVFHPSVGALGLVYGGFGGGGVEASTFTYEFGGGGVVDNTSYIGDLVVDGGYGGAAGFIHSGAGGGGAGIDTPGGAGNIITPGAGGGGSPIGGSGGVGRTTSVAFGAIGAVGGGGGGGGFLAEGTGEAQSLGGTGGPGYIKVYYNNNVTQSLFYTQPTQLNPTTSIWPSETLNWTIPEHVDSVLIECWGAGGSGGEGVDANLQRGAGGGGAGGNYARKLLTNFPSTNPGTLILYIAGAAGYPTPAQSVGNEGDVTYVQYGANVVCRATGGRQGGQGVGNSEGVGAVANLVSSTGVTCIGDVIWQGGNGSTASDFPNYSGAGGGAASGFGNGNSGVGNISGSHKFQWGGSGGNVRTSAQNDQNDGYGDSGGRFGGGGGGGFSPTVGRREGGFGSGGAIQLTWVTNQTTSSNFLPFFLPT
jgi:hypothetical protein